MLPFVSFASIFISPVTFIHPLSFMSVSPASGVSVIFVISGFILSSFISFTTSIVSYPSCDSALHIMFVFPVSVIVKLAVFPYYWIFFVSFFVMGSG